MNGGGKRIAFRANYVEVVTVENLAKAFPDRNGKPSVSDAMHFIIDFFIWQSNMHPTQSKEMMATIYDMLKTGEKTS